MRRARGESGCGLAAALIVILGIAAGAGPAAAAPDDLQPVNLALGQAARQSSTVYGATASRANDGNTDGAFWDGSVSHTDYDLHAYWEVDLGAVRQIGRVEIYNRTDCCQDRLMPFMLMVSDNEIADADMSAADPGVTPGVMRTTVNGPVQTVYYIPVNRSGRYVRIALVGQNYLHLAEVRVLEADSAARGRFASQSSTVAGGDASNAVDANVDSAFADGSVASTNVETNPWWQVDLGVVRNIRQIDVWSSATDCCATQSPRLPLIVWMSNSPFTGDPATANTPGVHGYWLTQGNPASVIVDSSFRYLRVEAIGTDSLSLAEVQLWPTATGSDGGHASLSSLATGVDPNWTIDGQITSSMASTQSQSQPYLDIDLGGQRYLETVRLWSELTDYHLFVSLTPFVDTSGNPLTTVAATAALPGVTQWYGRGAVGYGASSTIATMQLGRFVRVMLDGTAPLALAEAEITTTEGFYMGSYNGQTYNLSAYGYPTFDLFGYFPRPNTPIDIYAYAPNATFGGGSYSFLGQAFTGTTPYMLVHAVAPSYQFILDGLTIPSSLWPTGGVAGMYAIAVDNGSLVVTPIRGVDAADYSFDSFYPINRYVSTDATPDGDAVRPPYLQYPLGTGNVHPEYTVLGYVLPTFLQEAMARFFPMGNPNTAAFAQYYNVNELGLGRVVGCTRGTFTLPNPQVSNYPTVQRNGTACYVNEYAPLDSNGNPVFGDQTDTLAAISSGATPLSTSFIVAFDFKNYNYNEVWFGSYVAGPGGHSRKTTTTALDSTGHNTTVPNNCLACHGGTAAVNSDGASDTRGYLLPLDIGSLAYGDDTYAQQAESLRQINAMIAASTGPPAVADFINGSYHGGVNVAGTAFDPNYVTAGWSVTPTQTKVYNQVIKPYCRACHQSQVAANGGIDFIKATDAEALRALIVSDVCVAHRMPHAQQPMLRFWGSGARAQLLGYFGRGDYAGQSCTP